jgi:phosphatidylglycerophosphatase A
MSRGPAAGRCAWLVATFFGTGRLRPAPGSWASAATVLLWWIIALKLSPQSQLVAVLALAGLAVGLGIPASTRVVRQTGLHDPRFIVIDEVAGQLIALAAAPLRWKSLLVGFILFRAFDILKPPPLRLLERLPEGAGIVIDDLGAGLYALAGMQLLLHYRWVAP